MTLQIATMQERDIPGIQHVAKVTWHHTYRGIIPAETQEKFLSNNYSDHAMKHRMNHSLVVVAKENQTCVGFLNLQSAGNVAAELAALYVLPEHQGRGAGSLLLKTGIEMLKVQTVYVSVEKENKIGKRFYDAKGYVLLEERQEHVQGTIFNILRMKWTASGGKSSAR